MSGWIGVDLDGTLAEYHGWNEGQIGAPVPRMLARVKLWLSEGKDVRIFTARVAATGLISTIGNVDGVDFAEEQRKLIQEWTMKHLGVALPVTATKDFGLVELWDDRAVGIVFNTGVIKA